VPVARYKERYKIIELVITKNYMKVLTRKLIANEMLEKLWIYLMVVTFHVLTISVLIYG